RARCESMDVVQDLAMSCLSRGIPFQIDSRELLAKYLARCIGNQLTDHYHAFRRSATATEIKGATIDLEHGSDSAPPVDEEAARAEQVSYLVVAIEYLATVERRLVYLRDQQGLSWAEAGAALGLSEDNARMRYQRALPHLAAFCAILRS